MNGQQRVQEQNRQAVIFTLRSMGMAEVRDIAAACGLTEEGARNHLAALMDAGRVTRKRVEKEQGGRRQYVYRLHGE